MFCVKWNKYLIPVFDYSSVRDFLNITYTHSDSLSFKVVPSQFAAANNQFCFWARHPVHDRITVQKKPHKATFFNNFWIPYYYFFLIWLATPWCSFLKHLFIYQGTSLDLLMFFSFQFLCCWHFMTARSYITCWADMSFDIGLYYEDFLWSPGNSDKISCSNRLFPVILLLPSYYKDVMKTS